MGYKTGRTDIYLPVPLPSQEHKHFSLVGNELYFDANLAETFRLY